MMKMYKCKNKKKIKHNKSYNSENIRFYERIQNKTFPWAYIRLNTIHCMSVLTQLELSPALKKVYRNKNKDEICIRITLRLQ